MTYKETLFFVAQCLTISLEDKKREEIELKLKSEKIDWEALVKLSTGHYVLPALYCNLKRVGFLKYLPEELVNFMQLMTEINRERNHQIIQQAKELNELLVANDITLVFLKGTGNLLEGLYEDIAERMVGDIDFIVSKGDYSKAIRILSDNNYRTKIKEKYIQPFRHYPRLTNDKGIAAIEIHSELTKEKYTNEFNFDIIQKELLLLNEVNVLGFEDQLALSIISNQINDDGFYYKNIALRNAYDVFLLSKMVNVKHVISNFNALRSPLNCFLAICYHTFGKVDSLSYESTNKTKKYLTIFNEFSLNADKNRNRRKRIDMQLYIRNKFENLYKFFFDKKYRDWKLNNLFDKY